MSGGSGPYTPGEQVGDYLLEHELPARRAGELAFSAVHVVLPRRVRIVMPVALGRDARVLLREACILEALRHPAVPRIYDCSTLPDRRPWIAVDHVVGDTVAARAAARRYAPAEVARLVRECSEILEHAHERGVVHGGLCTELLLETDDGLQIADWSPATFEDRPSDDIRALGAIAYHVLAGGEPALTIVRHCPDAPARLTSLVDRMRAGIPAAADVRGEIAVLQAESARPMRDDDGTPIEEVDVVLVDISRDPPPIPRRQTGKWMPPSAYVARTPPPMPPGKKP